MIAITTSNSMSVKPVRRFGKRFMELPFGKRNIANKNGRLLGSLLFRRFQVVVARCVGRPPLREAKSCSPCGSVKPPDSCSHWAWPNQAPQYADGQICTLPAGRVLLPRVLSLVPAIFHRARRAGPAKVFPFSESGQNTTVPLASGLSSTTTSPSTGQSAGPPQPATERPHNTKKQERERDATIRDRFMKFIQRDAPIELATPDRLNHAAISRLICLSYRHCGCIVNSRFARIAGISEKAQDSPRQTIGPRCSSFPLIINRRA